MDAESLHWFKSSHSSSAHDCLEAAFTGPAWFKSSHSNLEGGCLEASFTGPAWLKSSHSSFEGGEYVEVAFADRPVVLVRDTQNREHAMLGVGAREWARLLRLVTT
ncbi:DUF397 domain-containing protein [Nocardiopsis dassonvillei]|uniref:DUF397 domain-containing protein n=1 Tax=Nocardiopsis dassonvillei TaxID=2014 RepID=UPI00340C2267